MPTICLHEDVRHEIGVETRCPEVKSVDLRMLVTEAKSFGMPLEHFPNMHPFAFKATSWMAEVYRLLDSQIDAQTLPAGISLQALGRVKRGGKV